MQAGAVERLTRWSDMVTGRGLCHHPDGVAQLVCSALAAFAAEIAAHSAGWCSARDRRPLLPVPVDRDPLERR